MHTFEYDPFQKQAIDAILQNTSVFVSAPTGAGKTVIAEVAVEQAMQAGGMAIYTAPVKALSNQKFRDFHKRYGDKVGILTGDLTLNPDGKLLIMTTEIYRNSLFEGGNRFQDCKWVIYDEVHYLDDPERGTVWEESLLMTPMHTEILALSATIPNAKELANWIEQIHGRPVEVVSSNYRPIPLDIQFQCQNRVYNNFDGLRKSGYMGKNTWKVKKSSVPMRGRGGKKRFRTVRHGNAPEGIPNDPRQLFNALEERDHLPCIYFCFGRKRTELLAWELAERSWVHPKESKALLKQYDELLKKYDIQEEVSAQSMRDLVKQGVAFHHAGLLPTLKEVVEVLFSTKMIKIIITTETFALGINMPARSVALDSLLKRNSPLLGRGGSRPRSVMPVRSFNQMTGRAGRRGLDTQGFAYVRVNPWEVDFDAVKRIVESPPERIQSRFNLCYATLLNLYERYGENLVEFYKKTFHAYQTSKQAQKETFALVKRRLELLKTFAYIESGDETRGVLTHKGQIACNFYGYELIVSELLEEGWLDTLSIADLGILLLAIVFEPRPGRGPRPRIPRRIGHLVDTCAELMEAIDREEYHFKISPRTKQPAFDLSKAMERWIGGMAFENLMEMVENDEGEIIRYFRMTIQLARELSLSSYSSPRLKENAKLLLDKINRDVVDAEAELRKTM